VDGTQHLVLVLDPTGVNGAPEIVYVTAHTAATTVCTIARAQESTNARSHATGTTWFHAPTARDFELSPNALAPLATRYAQVVANQAAITTVVDLAGLSVTVLVPANRRIKITGYISECSNDTIDFGGTLFIMEGATQLQQADWLVARAGFATACSVMGVLQPSAGSHTYKLTMQNLGGGIVTMLASATKPAFILVEDIGPVI
jgi:hypothetical protein